MFRATAATNSMPNVLTFGCLVAALLFAALTGAAEETQNQPSSQSVILDATSCWRCYFTYLPEIVRQESGELSAAREKTIKWARQEIKTEVFSSRPPPSDWAEPDFDDGFWVRRQGPFSGRVTGYPAEPSIPAPPLRLLCLRSKFEVRDPVKVKGLELSLSYAGGVVVYLNGREMARGHMPAGNIASGTLAQDYPAEVYVDDRGALLPIQGPHSKELPEYQDRYRRRVRHLENVTISATHLRKGINVLAVELHMPPVSYVWYEGRRRGGQSYTWPMVALNKLTLSANPGGAVVPNVSRPNKVQVWSALVSLAVYDGEYGDPNEPLRPITMVGAPGGSFSGQVVMSSPGPIQNLKVQATGLTQTRGQGHIPSSQVSIRYALPDGFPYINRRSGRRDDRTRMRRRFDGLEENVPVHISAQGEDNGVTQPIWITVDVPRDASPGDYEGTVTLWVNDSKSFAVHLNLHVADYVLPCPQDFLSFVGLVQSPETISLKYSAPMWSRQHWKLVEQSLELMGQVGSNKVFIPLITGTHLGNEHGMVRWIKKKDGTYNYDYALFEKYLDLAIKHLGRNLVVCFYVWDPKGAYSDPRECIPLKVTLSDPDTGALEEMLAPAWDSPESAAFWKPVFDGLKERLAARGMLNAMAVGVAGQGNPEAAIPVLNAIVPEARWVMAQHGYVSHIGGKPVAEAAVVFNWPGNMNLVPVKRFFGWKDPRVINYFPRRFPISVNDSSPGPLYRLLVEMLQTCGFDGVSRIGADFWYLETTHRGRTRRERIIKSNWQQLSLASQGAGQLLAAGKHGPIATARFEMLREGIQETETRIFIEKALTDPEKRAQLGEALAKRCQQLLDERVQAMLIAVGSRRKGDILFRHSQEALLWYAAHASRRSRKLYDLAAEVARKLGIEQEPASDIRAILDMPASQVHARTRSIVKYAVPRNATLQLHRMHFRQVKTLNRIPRLLAYCASDDHSRVYGRQMLVSS